MGRHFWDVFVRLRRKPIAGALAGRVWTTVEAELGEVTGARSEACATGATREDETFDPSRFSRKSRESRSNSEIGHTHDTLESVSQSPAQDHRGDRAGRTSAPDPSAWAYVHRTAACASRHDRP